MAVCRRALLSRHRWRRARVWPRSTGPWNGGLFRYPPSHHRPPQSLHVHSHDRRRSGPRFLTALDERQRVGDLVLALGGSEMIELNVNCSTVVVVAPEDMPLLWVLRDVLGMTGTKFGCGIAQCGACTVHLDGEPTRSCVTALGDAAGKAVTTIEAIGAAPAGWAIQQAWLDLEVVQCGYCQSGQIMSAAALIAGNPEPTDDDIDLAMSGNICRCGAYVRIREAIKHAATSVRVQGDRG
jgi:isoquinoline 1-oxidoreductase subunit alpha